MEITDKDAFTPEELEQMREAEEARERELSEMQTSDAAPKKAAEMPLPPPVDLPALLGHGPNGPHFVRLPREDGSGSDSYQIAPFTLKVLPTASQHFAALPGMIQYAALAWSRMEDGAEEIDPDQVVRIVRDSVPAEAEEHVDREYVIGLLHAAPLQVDEEAQENLCAFLSLALSRFGPGVSPEKVAGAVDAPFAIRLVGQCLKINAGLSNRFFAPSAHGHAG